jgi:hypothetical protein
MAFDPRLYQDDRVSVRNRGPELVILVSVGCDQGSASSRIGQRAGDADTPATETLCHADECAFLHVCPVASGLRCTVQELPAGC